jgi:hypothetical protein
MSHIAWYVPRHDYALGHTRGDSQPAPGFSVSKRLVSVADVMLAVAIK